MVLADSNGISRVPPYSGCLLYTSQEKKIVAKPATKVLPVIIMLKEAIAYQAEKAKRSARKPRQISPSARKLAPPAAKISIPARKKSK